MIVWQELAKQIDDYLTIYEPDDQLEWKLVLGEIKAFIEVSVQPRFSSGQCDIVVVIVIVIFIITIVVIIIVTDFKVLFQRYWVDRKLSYDSPFDTTPHIPTLNRRVAEGSAC